MMAPFNDASKAWVSVPWREKMAHVLGHWATKVFALFVLIGLIGLVWYNNGWIQDSGSLYRQAEDYKSQGNYAEAARIYRNLAEGGEAQAQMHIGYMCEKGEGVTRNYKEAAKWYYQAATQGESWAEYNLARLYLMGNGVAKDITEAMLWLRKAGDHGYTRAQYKLGQMYLYGLEIRQDKAEGLKWFRLAAHHGDEEAKKVVEALEAQAK